VVEADPGHGAVHQDVSRMSGENPRDGKERDVRSDSERESLAAKFDRHADDEGAILAEYRELAAGLGESAIGMLVNQILTEEEMHHLLLRTMATWLRKPADAAQAMRIPERADRAEILRRTQLLRMHERETIDACRRLEPQLSGELAGFLGILLNAMILDSEKHEKLLRAIETMLPE